MVVFIVVPKNSGLKSVSERVLSQIDSTDSRIVKMRGEDIPFFVDKLTSLGKNAIGMTGEDLYREYQAKVYDSSLSVLKKYSWRDESAIFGRPVLALIGPKKKNLDNFSRQVKIAIAKKYQFLAKKYLNLLEETQGFTFQKMYLSGSVEMSITEGLSDLVIDIVYSGKTIRELGLIVYDKIFESNFVVIGGRR